MSRTSARSRATALLAIAALASVAAAAPSLPGESNGSDGGSTAAVTNMDMFDVEVPRVVVGTADSGVNPYHYWFRTGEDSAVTQHVLDDFGIDNDHILNITDDFLADEAAGMYANIVPGEAYWFRGTNIIAQADDSNRPFIADGSTHGVGVTSSIAAGNREAIIYFAEGTDAIGDVFANPNVDIVSTSFGFITGVPIGPIDGSYDGVMNGGKLYFAATPNDPSLQMNDNASGPWWAVGVAGFEEGTSEGKQVTSGSTPELVADFTQQLPYCAYCTSAINNSVGGTSFATPITAGTVSHALLNIRRKTGHLGGISADGNLVDADGLTITNWDLRRAVEEGAAIPEMVVGTRNVTDLVAVPVTPVAPYAIVGWGLITPDEDFGVVSEIMAHLGFGEITRTKSIDTCIFMGSSYDTRVAAWDANFTSDTFGETNTLSGTDYQYC